ncbi:MAG: hypothetical protein R2769_08005 [Saprospiraceae bacterium]
MLVQMLAIPGTLAMELLSPGQEQVLFSLTIPGYEGVDTVSLTVEENGCSSDATEGFISIQNPLPTEYQLRRKFE